MANMKYILTTNRHKFKGKLTRKEQQLVILRSRLSDAIHFTSYPYGRKYNIVAAYTSDTAVYDENET